MFYFSVFFVCLCTSFSVFILSTTILAKKTKWRVYLPYFGVFFVLHLLLNIFLMKEVSFIYEYMWIILMSIYLIHGFVLGILFVRTLQISLLKAFSSIALSQFIILTFGDLFSNAMLEYGKKILSKDDVVGIILFIDYLPHVAIVIVSIMTIIFLKKIDFSRYFNYLFTSKIKSFITLLICLGLMYGVIFGFTLFASNESGFTNTLIALILIIIILVVVQFAAMYVSGMDKIRAQAATIAQQQEYMKLLEELQQEMRAFRHDFTNLFSGLALQAQEGDLNAIQEFMHTTSSYFDEKLGDEILQLEGLSNVQIYPLRSLLTAKLAVMREKHIDTELEILFPVTGADIGGEDLLRCMGILLDNAMEAALSKGLVKIMVLQQESELDIVVSNTFDKKPNLQELHKAKYTTKGTGRGMGLTSYRKILYGYPNCVMRTYIKENFFTQELRIPVSQKKEGRNH